MISMKNAAERLIVALDFEESAKALELVGRLEGTVSFYKVGYEMFIRAGLSFVRELIARGNLVFLDLKIDDIPETVKRAVSQAAEVEGISFLTIYGGGATARAAAEGKQGSKLRTLQVTLLTSMSADDLEQLKLVGEDCAFATTEAFVRWRAEQSILNGADGVIASGQNAGMLRRALADGPLIVCPGIRPAGANIGDHKRPAFPFETIRDGADYLVVGRPIRDAADPGEQAAAIVEDIRRGLATRA